MKAYAVILEDFDGRRIIHETDDCTDALNTAHERELGARDYKIEVYARYNGKTYYSRDRRGEVTQ